MRTDDQLLRDIMQTIRATSITTGTVDSTLVPIMEVLLDIRRLLQQQINMKKCINCADSHEEFCLSGTDLNTMKGTCTTKNK